MITNLFLTDGDSTNTTSTTLEPTNLHNETNAPHSFLGLTGEAADGLAGGLVGVCILGAGLASGLNLCLLSLDPDAVYATATNPFEEMGRRNTALRVSSILKHQYWLLVTTLVWNALFAETLPLLLDQLVPNPIIVVLISTLAILVFGEVIPQSFFTRYALAVAGFLTPIVWLMMILSSPVSVPVAKVLDILLGHRPQDAMKRIELRELIALNTMTMGYDEYDDENVGLLDDPDGKKHHHHHGGGGQNNNNAHGGAVNFTPDEVALLNGALNLSEKTVLDAMHETEFIECIFMIEENRKLTKNLVEEIKKSGKTRIPVFNGDRRNITGFIFSHAILQVLFMAERDAPLVKECGVTSMARCNAGDLLVVLFRPFLADAQDIAVVHDDGTGLPIGIVTKWDLLSFLFNEQISAEKWSSHEADLLAKEVMDMRKKQAKAEMIMLNASNTSRISHSLKRPESFRHAGSRGSRASVSNSVPNESFVLSSSGRIALSSSGRIAQPISRTQTRESAESLQPHLSDTRIGGGEAGSSQQQQGGPVLSDGSLFSPTSPTTSKKRSSTSIASPTKASATATAVTKDFLSSITTVDSQTYSPASNPNQAFMNPVVHNAQNNNSNSNASPTSISTGGYGSTASPTGDNSKLLGASLIAPGSPGAATRRSGKKQQQQQLRGSVPPTEQNLPFGHRRDESFSNYAASLSRASGVEVVGGTRGSHFKAGDTHRRLPSFANSNSNASKQPMSPATVQSTAPPSPSTTAAGRSA